MTLNIESNKNIQSNLNSNIEVIKSDREGYHEGTGFITAFSWYD